MYFDESLCLLSSQIFTCSEILDPNSYLYLLDTILLSSSDWACGNVVETAMYDDTQECVCV